MFVETSQVCTKFIETPSGKNAFYGDVTTDLKTFVRLKWTRQYIFFQISASMELTISPEVHFEKR